jgi:predicted N-acyltransferase
MRLLSLLFWVLIVTPAFAGKADVIDVKVLRESNGMYSFDVTILSDETGWEKYADKWEVVAPDGTVLGTRILAHPHVDEQPFTRSLDGVAVPENISRITVRAHDKVEGYGGKEIVVSLPK